jgi:hypothetical protein
MWWNKFDGFHIKFSYSLMHGNWAYQVKESFHVWTKGKLIFLAARVTEAIDATGLVTKYTRLCC